MGLLFLYSLWWGRCAYLSLWSVPTAGSAELVNLSRYLTPSSQPSWTKQAPHRIFAEDITVMISSMETKNQCCGSVTFWYGSGSGSCYFRQWPTRWQQKIHFFLRFFANYSEATFTSKVIKKSQNRRNQGFRTIFAWWWKDPDPDPNLVLMDPDLGGPKQRDPTDLDPQHCKRAWTQSLGTVYN